MAPWLISSLKGKRKLKNPYQSFGNEKKPFSPSATEIAATSARKNIKMVPGAPMPYNNQGNKTREMPRTSTRKHKFNWRNLFANCFIFLRRCSPSCICCCSGKLSSRHAAADMDDEEDIDKAFAQYKSQMNMKDFNGSNLSPSQKSTLRKTHRNNKYWNWNESLRSNNDKFLETLEFDDISNDRTLKMTKTKRNQHPQIGVHSFRGRGIS